MEQNLYPLRAALAVAGSSPGRFHNHVGTGAVDCALALIGDADAHLTPPRRGAGAGTGGGRLISEAATVAVAIAFLCLPGQVHNPLFPYGAPAFVVVVQARRRVLNMACHLSRVNGFGALGIGSP